jgi:hypothetical protein
MMGRQLINGVALQVLLLFATTTEAIAQSSTTIHQTTLPAIGQIEQSKEGQTPAEKKISSKLLQIIKKTSNGQTPPVLNGFSYGSTAGVTVDIKAKVTPGLLDAISKVGGKIINKFPEYDAIRATIPPSNIKSIAVRPEVNSISVGTKPNTNSAAPDNEGDIAHGANLVRVDFGVEGAGVKIGVLSDSIDDGNGALEAAYQTGALDRSEVSILPDQDGDGNGEGLAMLEIIHAIAPKAHLYFATGDGGIPQMAANIKALRNVGCKIIVDDLTYPNESPFQDNEIGMEIDEASTAGVLYFSAAANSGNLAHHSSSTWEGDFKDGGPADTKYGAAGKNSRVNIFSGRVTLNTVDRLTGNATVSLFWSDPLHESKNEYDLFVVGSDGRIKGFSITSHATGKQDPYQSVDGVHVGDSVVIVKAAGAQNRFLHLDITGARISDAYIRYNTGGSVRGHNASGADNAFSVAAAKAPAPPSAFSPTQTQTVETYSADGPRRIFFKQDGTPLTPGDFSSLGGKVLQKPDITAADGVTTTLSHYSQMNPFEGTSAAAPQVAAIAALLLSCAPSASPAEIRAALQQSAMPVDGTSPNATAGYGIAMARDAAKKVCPARTVSN